MLSTVHKTHYFILQYSIEGEIAGHMSKAYLKHHIKCIHKHYDIILSSEQRESALHCQSELQKVL